MFGPVSAITLFFARAFDFSGRATRAEFWWVQLVFAIVMGLAASRDMQRLMAETSHWTADPTLVTPVSMATTWLVILAFLPMLSLTIRRLHDAGYSGFWYLLQLVPVIGPLVLFVFCVSPSQHIANRWGAPRDPEDPMGGATIAVPRQADPVAAPSRPDQRPRKRSAWDGYALLVDEDAGVPPEREAARKAEVSAYYRSRVLKDPLAAE